MHLVMRSHIHVHLCVQLNAFTWERPHISRKRNASESNHVYCPCFHLLVVELSPRLSQLLKNMGEVYIQVNGPFTTVISCPVEATSKACLLWLELLGTPCLILDPVVEVNRENPTATCGKICSFVKPFHSVPCHGCPVSVPPWLASWHTQLCLHLFLVWSQSLVFLCETIWKYLGFVLLWAL